MNNIYSFILLKIFIQAWTQRPEPFDESKELKSHSRRRSLEIYLCWHFIGQCIIWCSDW